MITKITGFLKILYEERVILSIPPVEIEVYIPEYTRRQLQGLLEKEITLHTSMYMDGNPMRGRVVPRLLGFLTEAEREFFDILCSVDGLGTKKVLRAMARPVREIAVAIQEQNVKFIASLPEIGPSSAERVVAKLRKNKKVSKFTLMVSKGNVENNTVELSTDVITETFEALLFLGHSEIEARCLIDSVLESTKKSFKDSDELIKAIYNHTK